MEDFDITYGQSLLDNRNYFEYANYLSKFRGNNPRNQAELNAKIKQYKRLGAMQEAVLEDATDEEKQAYHYIASMNGAGTIPRINEDDVENIFGTTYVNSINSLKSRDGKRINTLNIKYNKGEFNQLCFNLNTTPQDLYRDYGITASEDASNGTIKLNIKTDNKRLPEILNANYEFDLNNIRTEDPSGNYMTSLINNYKRTYNNQRISAIDEDGAVLTTDDFNKSNLDIALGAYNKAKNLNKNLLDRQQSISKDERLISTGFLGEGHKQAYDQWIAGKIKTSEYEAIVKARTQRYNALLRDADFTQMQMYVAGNTDDDNFVLRSADNPERLRMMRIISAAMDEDRIGYSAAMLNGQLGTVLTISQKFDKDRKLSDKEGDRMYRIFVPGLFTKSAQKTFESDNQGAAVVENADMKRWNYSKTLSNGNRIGYDKTIGAYALAPDNYGKLQKVPVDESYILSELNRDIVVENVVDKVFGLFNNNNQISNDILKGKSQKDFLDAVILNLSTVASNELYPSDSYTSNERIYQRDELYRTIYKLLENRLTNYGHK